MTFVYLRFAELDRVLGGVIMGSAILIGGDRELVNPLCYKLCAFKPGIKNTSRVKIPQQSPYAPGFARKTCGCQKHMEYFKPRAKRSHVC